MAKINLTEYLKFGGNFEDLVPSDISIEIKLALCFIERTIIKIVEEGKNEKNEQLYEIFFDDNSSETLHGKLLYVDVDITVKPKRVNRSNSEKALEWWRGLSWTDKGLLMEGDFKHSQPQYLIKSEIEKLWLLNNPEIKTRKLYCWLSDEGRFSNSWNDITQSETIGKDLESIMKKSSEKNWKLIEYTVLNNKQFEFYNRMRLA